MKRIYSSFLWAMNKPNGYQYLALGDSYTIGESVAPAESFPAQLAAKLSREGIKIYAPTIVARNSWTTSELSSAMDCYDLQPSYDVVTLLIGVNNQYRGLSMRAYESEFGQVLQRSIRLAGGKASHVVVLSIPDYGCTPFGKAKQASISAEMDQFNAVNRKVAVALGVGYLFITESSRRAQLDPTLIALDGLHPSAKLYALWVEELSTQLETILMSQ